jgi:hypothetical protein
METGGQSMKMEITQTIAEEDGAWVVTEAAALPTGSATDKTVLDKHSLIVRSREIRQGPIAVDLKFADGKASGTISMGGQEKPLSVDLGGELFADGGGAHSVLGTLPLTEGYTTTFRNFDVQAAKPTLKQAKVAGVEEVSVPAGTFKAWKVEIKSAEGEPGQQTVWIDTATRKVVKVFATLPRMAGATLTSELVK